MKSGHFWFRSDMQLTSWTFQMKIGQVATLYKTNLSETLRQVRRRKEKSINRRGVEK